MEYIGMGLGALMIELCSIGVIVSMFYMYDGLSNKTKNNINK